MHRRWLTVAGAAFVGLIATPAPLTPELNLLETLERIVGNAGEEDGNVIILTDVVRDHYSECMPFDGVGQALETEGFTVSPIKSSPNGQGEAAARYIATRISRHAFRLFAYWEYKIVLKVDRNGTVYDIFAGVYYESL